MDENKNETETTKTSSTSFGSQPFQTLGPPPPEQQQSASRRKFLNWRNIFIALGVLQVLGVVSFLLIIFSVVGKTGSEFIALGLGYTLLPALGLISLVNLIGLPIYFLKHKPHGKKLALVAISFVVSLILGLYGAYNAYQVFFVVPQMSKDFIAKMEQERQLRDQQFAADNAKPEITKEEAIELLKSCQLKGFYYTNQTDKQNGGWGELSSTGIVLTKIDGKPYRISIADRLVPELVPAARAAQKTCTDPQFSHEGTYEEYKDGKWYFKGQVVNDLGVAPGRSTDELITVLQNCKIDYFVGYSDLSLVKDANTRSWLERAEKSNTGIEISEGSATSYVFVSKAQTIALQDKAREYRQTCISKKKLYITIDSWIETEYPAGQWSRIKQQ